jgi:hypothetical protein
VTDRKLRLDGATQGDQIEATALIVGGGALLCMPLLALIDGVPTVWLMLSLGGGLAGLAIAGLGVRWFSSEGSPLESSLASSNAAFVAMAQEEVPINLLLVEARQRFQAHCLRFVALGAGAVLMVFDDLGDIMRWLVVALFIVSFVADQFLLRPRRYILHEERLSRTGLFAPLDLAWETVKTVYWRHYPDDVKPPFPSGERLIFDLEEGSDLEFVFRGTSASDDAARLARALLPRLGNRLRILTPRRERAEIGEHNVSEHVAVP